MFKSIKDFFAKEDVVPEGYVISYTTTGHQSLRKLDISEPIIQWCKLLEEDFNRFVFTGSISENNKVFVFTLKDSDTGATMSGFCDGYQPDVVAYNIRCVSLDKLRLTSDEHVLIEDTWQSIIQSNEQQEQQKERERLCSVYNLL
tara:strand:- start:518 stop:952 length:435 start_codon:yes stop_codon:yes gene_type:complete